MSAFVVSKSHIHAMIRVALAHRMSYLQQVNPSNRRYLQDLEDVTGQMPLDYCVCSVCHRYQHS